MSRLPNLRRVLILALSLLIPLSVAAASWLAPSRALSETEKLEYSVGWAKAICVARLVSVVDQHEASETVPGSYRTKTYLVAQPLQWLKGDGRNTLLHVGTSIPDAPAFERLNKPSLWNKQIIILFMVPAPSWPEDPIQRAIWPYAKSVRWLFNSSPSSISRGVLSPTRGSETAAIKHIRRILRAQSIESHKH